MAENYRSFFSGVTGNRPYEYQAGMAEQLFAGAHVLARVPTGCGKTHAAVMPFLFDRALEGKRIGARRLIYVLPMRTLVRSIERDLRSLVERARIECSITVQTGEEPGDPYFDQGDITVTTFDQFLSGLLCGPYGLSGRQFNVNAAAAMGNLVVFDEFHLMDPDKAFLSSVAMMQIFRSTCRTVWMTATATSPLADALRGALDVKQIAVGAEGEKEIPAIAGVQRKLVRVREPLSVEHLLRHRGKRVVAVVNQVKRAQQLFEDLLRRHSELGMDVPVRCLHGRFFRSHRNATEAWLRGAFGKGATQPAVLIATQVVEAGIDISAETLLTELAPANSLMQRAGRCARFPGQSGVVEIYDLPEAGMSHLPYRKEIVESTDQAIGDGGMWSRKWADELIEAVHRATDGQLVENKWPIRRAECMDAIRARCMKLRADGISGFIREGSDTVRVAVARDPGLPHWRYESIQIYRESLRKLASIDTDCLRRWDFDEQQWVRLSGAEDVARSLIVAIAPGVAGYTAAAGLRLFEPGSEESPVVPPREKERPRPIRRETWTHHAYAVASRAQRGLDDLGRMLERGPLTKGVLETWLRFAALAHDAGKLQASWQRWASRYQSQKSGETARGGEPLAHTDFDYADAGDRLLSRSVRPVRPTHSSASAWYASTVEWDSAGGGLLKPAALFAIAGHHGGWWDGASIEPLDANARAVCAEVGLVGLASGAGPGPGPSKRFENRWLRESLSNRFEEFWPAASILVRLLRIADQRSLEEANAD